jgi:hypothetical protein
VQQSGGLRGFVQRPLGRTALLAFAILVTFATYVYLSTLLAIPVLLLVGLAVPIWFGLKQLRTLALFGLVILLLVAPLATVVITEDVRTPLPPIDSPVLTWSNSSVAFSTAPGNFSYAAPPVNGYASALSNATLGVRAANVSVSVIYTQDTLLYPVTFTEQGLPSGTDWSVMFGTTQASTTTGSMAFTALNGTYPFSIPNVAGYTAAMPWGTVQVNGGAVGRTVVFGALPTVGHSVTFAQSGLPSGSAWSVGYGNVSRSSTNGTVEFTGLPNWTLDYSVANAPGYVADPAAGTVVVNGTNVTVDVAFDPVPARTFTVTFYEKGLPIGANWNLTFNGSMKKGVAAAATGSLLENASVTPYLGGSSTNFTWSVEINASAVPGANSSPLWLNLYISTCPGATSPNNDPNCNAGYPFWLLNVTLPQNLTGTSNYSFHFAMNSDSIWAWQMGVFLRNYSAPPGTNRSLTYLLLQGDPVYNGLEGPVTGSFLTTYGQLVLTVYLNDFIYLGIPYFVVLLIYSYITRRKAARADMMRRAADRPPSDAPGSRGDGPPGPAAPSDAQGRRPSAAPRRTEMSCPNCGAVVYENETTCWKCGTAIPLTPGPAPLPSGAGGPPPKS